MGFVVLLKQTLRHCWKEVSVSRELRMESVAILAQVRRTPFVVLLKQTLLSSNGEGDEGYEEEIRQQDWKGPHGQGDGAPRQQGQDRGWADRKGPDEEQVRQDCEQEEERFGQDQPMDRCRQEGTRRVEDQGLLCDQEGHAIVPEGEGVLQVSALMLEQTSCK